MRVRLASEASREKLLLAAWSLAALGWVSLLPACAPLRGHSRALPGHHVEQETESDENPDLTLLLGIHRLAGVLIGDAALRTELEEIRVRVSDPMTIEPYFPSRRVPFPATGGSRDRMREILERAFADRIRVLVRGSPDDSVVATHTLEAMISNVEKGVELEFRLLTVNERYVAGVARGVVKGASLSLVAQDRDQEDDYAEGHEEENRLWILAPSPSSSTEPVQDSQPGTVAGTSSPTGPPGVPRPDPALPAGDVPPPAGVPGWIYDLLSNYSGPEDG